MIGGTLIITTKHVIAFGPPMRVEIIDDIDVDHRNGDPEKYAVVVRTPLPSGSSEPGYLGEVIYDDVVLARGLTKKEAHEYMTALFGDALESDYLQPLSYNDE